MNENEKVMNFNEADENMENQVQDTPETTIQGESKKRGPLSKIKWWHIAMLAGAGILIYKGVKGSLKASNDLAVDKVKVVVPMDPNNEMDNKVQDLVNTLAESMTESVEETAPF